MVDATSGPVYAEFYERQMVTFDQTLTHDGEIKLIRVERPAIHEDAPLQVQVIDDQEQPDHAA